MPADNRIGLYGLLGQTVASRTSEIGVRMALGAGRRQVIGLVVGRTVAVTTIGLAPGLAAAAVIPRSHGTMIIGVKQIDPVMLTGEPVLSDHRRSGRAGAGASSDKN